MNRKLLKAAVEKAMDERNLSADERKRLLAATCSRCGTVLATDPSLTHMITLKVASTTDPDFDSVVLCGRCATDFAEFAHPELLRRPSWVAAATARRAAWPI